MVKNMLRNCFLLGVLIFSLVGCAKKDPIVARVGKHGAISWSQVQAEYEQSFRRDSNQKPELKDYLDCVENLVNREIKIQVAYSLGLDKDSTIQRNYDLEKRQALLSQLYQKEIVDRIVRESDIRSFYGKTGKEVVIRTIFFQFPYHRNSAQEDSIKAKAQEILNRLKKGESFSTLARMYSEDPTTALNGGLVGALSYTRGDDPIRNAAFSMKEGEISGLIRNDRGYHIIKVEEIRFKEREPFEKAHDKIRGQLIAERRAELSEAAKTYWERVKAKHQFKMNYSAIDTFVKYFDSREFYTKSFLLDTLAKLPSRVQDLVLVQYKNGKLDVRGLRNRLKEIEFPLTGIRIGFKPSLTHYLERWTMNDFLTEIALKKRLDRKKTVQQRLQNALEREMIHNLQRNYIWKDIHPSEEEIKAYYEQEKFSRYAEPEKVRIQEVWVKDKNLALEIMEKCKNKKDLGRFPAQYTIRPGYKERNGMFDPFPKGKWNVIGDSAFALQVGEMAGPIPLREGGYSVIKLLEKIPPKPIAFEKVRSRVIRDLMRMRQEEKEKAWLEEQKKKIPVYVDKKQLEKLAYAKD